MNVLFAIAVVLVLLIANEYWWRHRRVHGEMSRKFIHITVGSFVAFWPFFMSWHTIQFISAAFLISVVVSKYFNVFSAIHAVQRPTWGEVYFALAVGFTTLITTNKWIYMTALLQMSLADGLAAVLGVKYGKRRHYLIMGHPKSVAGTLTFFVVSFLLLGMFSAFSGFQLSPFFVIGLSSGAALIENIGVGGIDNLLVPIFIATILELVA
jgi:phytol kinase